MHAVTTEKKRIALVAGGNSGEYVISVESAGMIKKNIDPRLFEVYTIMIRGAEWFYLPDAGEPLAVNKNDFSIELSDRKLCFDCAFITIHGTPGEDGKLQGYFDMLGIPYTVSGVLQASLTFNKYFCNQLAARFGMHVAASVLLKRTTAQDYAAIIRETGLPLFVKPNKGGSSLGTTFVKTADQLPAAIASAFEHDDEALAESYIKGTELTCGVYSKSGEPFALPVTEIVSKSEAAFFDFKAKYTRGMADEITPARIPVELALKVQETTVWLYKAFCLKGLARIDYIFSEGKLFFLEINLTPGMADTSIVPQQAAVAGIPIKEIFTELIQSALGA